MSDQPPCCDFCFNQDIPLYEGGVFDSTTRICGGAFVGLEDIIARRFGRGGFGFKQGMREEPQVRDHGWDGQGWGTGQTESHPDEGTAEFARASAIPTQVAFVILDRSASRHSEILSYQEATKEAGSCR
jgi:hypothetical protein